MPGFGKSGGRDDGAAHGGDEFLLKRVPRRVMPRHQISEREEGEAEWKHDESAEKNEKGARKRPP